MWSGKVLNTATAPLFVAVGGGIALAAWFGTRHLATNPDVQVNKVQRKQTIRENFDEGKKWVQHHQSMKALPGNVVPEVEKKD